MKKQIILLLALLVFSPCMFYSSGILGAATVDDVIKRLDDALGNRDVHLKERVALIDSLKSEIHPDVMSRIKEYETVGNLYRNINIDSAVMYYNKALALARSSGDSEREGLILASRSALYTLMGATREAVVDFVAADTLIKSIDGRKAYFTEGCNMYENMISVYSFEGLKRPYEVAFSIQIDSLLTYLPEDSDESLFYMAHRYRINGKTSLMLAVLSDAVERLEDDDPMFGRCATMLGLAYSDMGRNDDAVHYLSLAALSNVYATNLTGMALGQLGILLYDKGDVSRGYRYLTAALDNAVLSESKMRAMRVSEFVPVVSRAFRERDQRKIVFSMVLVGALFVALMVVAYLSVAMRREMKKLKDAHAELAEANHKKDTHISEFLNLSSIYMEKLEEFMRIAKRKISVNQVDDLLNIIKSGKIIDEQTKVFYEIFDNAFINIYPTFVDEVNSLLLPDRRIEPSCPGSLTTELRILAFMRLRIDDTARVAKFMGLSVNTIYTYRNKIRGKAIDRDTFEKKVMEIGRIA